MGCVPNLPPDAEIIGPIVDDPFDAYFPLSTYWKPPLDVLTRLIAGIGITVDLTTNSPVVAKVISRRCALDPNATNNRASPPGRPAGHDPAIPAYLATAVATAPVDMLPALSTAQRR